MKKINLGCGNFKLEEYINIDIRESVKPDIVVNILKGLPFENGEIDEVSCTEFLEHFNQDDIGKVLLEIHRVLKKGGVFKFGLPNGMMCALLIAGHYRDDEKVDNLEYLWNNVHGQKGSREDYQDEQERNARLHRILFSKQYLILLLEKYGFKKIEFGQKMKAYEEWKEEYKLIGKVIKC